MDHFPLIFCTQYSSFFSLLVHLYSSFDIVFLLVKGKGKGNRGKIVPLNTVIAYRGNGGISRLTHNLTTQMGVKG